MKRLVLISGLVASSLMAETMCLNSVVSSEDEQANNTFLADASRCVNAYDVTTSGSAVSISTKIAGDDFKLHIFRKPECKISNVKASLVNKSDLSLVADSEGGVVADEASFNVKKANRDLLVKITYDKLKAVSCTLPHDVSSAGVCYSKDETKTEYSTDDFAIRPNAFSINLKKSKVKEGTIDYATIKALQKDGASVVDNYTNSSMNLDVKDINAEGVQYTFEINNGLSNKAQFMFLKPTDSNKVVITDKHYADVDSDDTIADCREFSGESNEVEVVESSKYWAGTGTNEAENNPETTTIQSKIKQNTKKDLHFQKMGW